MRLEKMNEKKLARTKLIVIRNDVNPNFRLF
jgi:hypothetical protein